ncbi:MAG: T9SS type A sorting domain-containing protein [Bacteroidetes bacterium]|nr:T9SS type A sorting domain-containing protein [Bacteroidota bacterium]
MKLVERSIFIFMLSSYAFLGKGQNNRLLESEFTKEKKIVPVEYEKGAESGARYNGLNNTWELTLDEFYNAENIQQPSSNYNSIIKDQDFLKSEEIKQLDPLALYEKVGEVETVVGKGSFKLEETTFKELIKTQKVIVSNSSSVALLTYTVFNNWYSLDEEEPKLILSIHERYVTHKNMGIYISEKTIFLNKQLKDNIIHHSITKAYPVPTENEINFEIFLKNRSEKVKLKVINLSGNIVLSKELGIQETGFKEYKLQLNDLSIGNYIIELFVDEIVYDRKKISVIH